MLLISAGITNAQESLRVATFHTGLKRAGPGLLLRDILRGEDPQILGVRDVIREAMPDIVLLTRFDFDLGNAALTAFADALGEVGGAYPYRFAFAPNSGVATGLDLDGDGYLGDARDKQGYGDFAGHGGMAILSRFPIDEPNARDFSGLLWRDFPGNRMPEFSKNSGGDALRLSSVGHWDIPVVLPDGTVLHLLAYHANTPAFDGPEDRNGLRNSDETLFWMRYLNGELSVKPAPPPYVILGTANLDPVDGQGLHGTIHALLGSGLVQDAEPRSSRAVIAAATQGGVNETQFGDPALDTADWKDVDGPGNLRVDYVLPSVEQVVTGSGVFWPEPEKLAEILADRGGIASWHGLVWVDIRR